MIKPHCPALRQVSLACAFIVAIVFVSFATAQPSILKTFTDAAAEGAAPVAPLAIRSDGVIFGATTSGGANGLGTIFRLAADGTGFTVLHHFAAVEGYNPTGGLLIASDGRLYGAATWGGLNNRGTIFRVDTDGTGFTVLHALAANSSEGINPIAGLTQGPDGRLYGAASLGGPDWGTLFRLNLDGSDFTLLHSFGPTVGDPNGSRPYGKPIFGLDGRLYGTTWTGGAASGQGTVFRMDANGADFTVLHRFGGAPDGAQPYAGLAIADDGRLYGTTNFGGSLGGGTVYRLNPDGTGLTILRHLGAGAPEGNGPFYGVPCLADARLYGTAGFNGTGGAGSVFSLNPDGTGFGIEATFTGTGKPMSGVRRGPDGRLYGTTREGGTAAFGTIFRVGSLPLPVPSFHGIGDLPGGAVFSEVRDATRVGGQLIAVGGSSANANTLNINTAVRWTSDGGLQALPNVVANLTGTNPVMASALTRDGTAIASRARSVPTGNGGRVAVKVTNQGATNTVLGHLPGSTSYSAATSISNDGAVVYGFSLTNATTGAVQAFRWTATTGLTAIPFVSGSDLTNFPAGRGSSADGAVLVGTGAAAGSGLTGAGNRAYLYVHGFGSAALPLFPGGTWNAALAVTSDGCTILCIGDSPNRPNGELALWNGATVAALGSPNPALYPGNFGGISDDGVAVIYFQGASGPSVSYVRNSHGWSVLEDALIAAGLDLTGWTLDSVLGISPDGTLVFGRGTHAGNQEGWVAELAPGYLAAFQSDTTPPTLTLPEPLTVEATSASGAAVVFAVSANDETDGPVPVDTSVASGAIFPLGSTSVAATATDAAGNSVTGAFTVTIVDTTAPNLVVPADLVIEANSPAGTIADFAADATDSVTANPTIVYGIAPGSIFPLGATVVTVTATDGAGNVASGSFTVTVCDTAAPTIPVVAASPSSLWPPNNKMVPITVTASAIDLVDTQPALRIVAVTCNEPAAGDWEITGDLTLRLRATRAGNGTGRIYTITVEARDRSGNAGTAIITVAVPHDRGR